MSNGDKSVDLLSHIEDVLRENEKYTKMLLRERNVNKLISNIDLAGEVGDVRALYPVLDVLSLTSNKRVIATALNTLGKLGDMSIIPVIAEYLYDDNSRVRANAVEALSQIGHPKIVRLVVPFLKDPDNRVRANAAKCLWKFGRDEIFHTLKEMLNSGSPRMKASAVYALTELGDENVIPLVKKSLEDEDSRVREVAQRCLKELEKKFKTRDALLARYGRNTVEKRQPKVESPPVQVVAPAVPEPEQKPFPEEKKPEPLPVPEKVPLDKSAEAKVPSDEKPSVIVPVEAPAKPLELPVEKPTAKEELNDEWGALMEMVSRAEVRIKNREASAQEKESFLVDEPDLPDLEVVEPEDPETSMFDLASLEAVISSPPAAEPVVTAPPVEPPAPEEPAPEEKIPPAAEPFVTAPPVEPPAPEEPAPEEKIPPTAEPVAAVETQGIPMDQRLLERLAEIDSLVQDAADFMNRVGEEQNTVRKVNVIEMAGKVGDPKALLPILDLLQVEKNERVISVGIKTIGQLGDESVVPFLLDYVVQDSARIRSSALEALDIVGHSSGIRGMISLLLDSNVMVRAKAAKALWKFEKDEIFTIIEEISADGTRDEKLAALHALEKLATDRAIELLEKFTAVNDLTIEREARSMLAKLIKEKKRKERFQKLASPAPERKIVAAVAPLKPEKQAEPVPSPPPSGPVATPAPAATVATTSAKSHKLQLAMVVLVLVILFIAGTLGMKYVMDEYLPSSDSDSSVPTPADNGDSSSSGDNLVVEPAGSRVTDRQVTSLTGRVGQFIGGAAFAIGKVTRKGKKIYIVGENLVSGNTINYSLESLPSETVVIMPKSDGVIMVHGENIKLAKRFIGKDVLLIRSLSEKVGGRRAGGIKQSPGTVSGNARSEIASFYQGLIKAWNDRDIDKLMDRYSPDFTMQGSDYNLLRESYLTEFEIAGEIIMRLEDEKVELQESGVRHTSTIYFEGTSADGFTATRENTYSRRIDTLKQVGGSWKIVFSEDILE